MTDLAIAVLKENATAAEGQMLALCVDPRDVLALIARVEKAEAEGALWKGKNRLIAEQVETRANEIADEAEAVCEVLRFQRDEARAGEARLRALLARAGEALMWFESRGCPDCGGDCVSANPPVSMCIMRAARTVARKIEESLCHG